MIVFFRCDGNMNIGSGHIMRCLSIADSTDAQEDECWFLTCDNVFENIIHTHGHKNLILNTDYKELNSDLESTKKLVEKYKPSVFFVDSYYVTDFYLSSLYSTCSIAGVKLVYLDDILSFPYSCDVLINYNIYGSDKEREYKELYSRNKNRKVPHLLLGTGYAPLRKEFQNLPERIVRRDAANILVSTGGADSMHLGLALVQAVINGGEIFRTYQFDFIIGPMNGDLEKIKLLASKVPNITLYHNVTSMSALMQKCDVAVSAAGSTLYELCATQTPAITYILADNQIQGAEGFERQGILKNIGDVRVKGCENLAEELIWSAVGLSCEYEERNRIAVLQRSIVDGMGGERIMEVLSHL
ncbi:UDP-2,4-diacetamido-2,4,6-trideoxy-beta-L-altropyranose hydrolase [Schaedlerella arabinosiphila]|nr:UDP-2,4-diacetamido-2,4,6-trideoxy-beta-L-altropyranose hydrolase [Schaedlerella arabinosiphila]